VPTFVVTRLRQLERAHTCKDKSFIRALGGIDPALDEAAAVPDDADFVDERDVGQTDQEKVPGYVLERR
jgi:hypothetical protein